MQTNLPGTANLALSPPTVGEAPRLRGIIKRCPADFQVTEVGVPDPDGDGPHLWLDLRRKDMDTAHAAILATDTELSQHAGHADRAERAARDLIALSARTQMDSYLEEGLNALGAAAG